MGKIKKKIFLFYYFVSLLPRSHWTFTVQSELLKENIQKLHSGVKISSFHVKKSSDRKKMIMRNESEWLNMELQRYFLNYIPNVRNLFFLFNFSQSQICKANGKERGMGLFFLFIHCLDISRCREPLKSKFERNEKGFARGFVFVSVKFNDVEVGAVEN